jgi:hypothetical protein
MEDSTPLTQPSGALVPPPSGPPTAVALATPEPPPAPRIAFPSARSYPFRQLINQTLDAVDELADTLAEGLGIR